jgi:hypothetical protein
MNIILIFFASLSLMAAAYTLLAKAEALAKIILEIINKFKK